MCVCVWVGVLVCICFLCSGIRAGGCLPREPGDGSGDMCGNIQLRGGYLRVGCDHERS